MSKSELLEIYLEKNNLQEKRLFACPLCPYRTDRRNNLKRHTATMHEKSAVVLECCSLRFANKAALRHHTAAYHRHGYICSICGRVFCRRALLRRHHAVHSGYKEFACNLCDYATSHKSNLERHMKIHEDGDKCIVRSKSASVSDEADVVVGSKCTDSPVRGHNPILASLLSQPSHPEVIQRNYHSPFQYNTHAFDESQEIKLEMSPTPEAERAALMERSWSYDLSPDGSFSGLTCLSQAEGQVEESAKYRPDLCKKEPAIPLRHAIDVILGVRDDAHALNSAAAGHFDSGRVVTPSSNHWSIGHVSCIVPDSGVAEYKFRQEMLMYSQAIAARDGCGDSGVESDRSSIGSVKRRCAQDDCNEISAVPDSSCPAPSSLDADYVYIPKKLRMSKRYQDVKSELSCQVSSNVC